MFYYPYTTDKKLGLKEVKQLAKGSPKLVMGIDVHFNIFYLNHSAVLLKFVWQFHIHYL